MSTTEAYQYEPLEDGSSKFRLLRLLPIRNSVIACQLEHSSITICEPYEALSYTWGSDEKVETITVNDKALDITDNLYAALKHLALPHKERVLWIDGICIDQSNDAEKSLQVQLMTAIYTNASCVIFWLGKATFEVRVLMKCLNRLHKLPVADYTLENAQAMWANIVASQDVQRQTAIGLQTILRRPWFERVWILQEVANARHGLICAGATSIPADIFALSISLIKPDVSGNMAYWQPVVDIMPSALRKQSWWADNPDLYTLMRKFKDSSATDARDTVYALLGLSVHDRDRDAVIVDYAKPIHEIFQYTLQYFIHSEKSRIDHVLNFAVGLSEVATVLVVVQEDSEAEVDVFDCRERRWKGKTAAYSRWLRSHRLTSNDRTNTSDIRTVGRYERPATPRKKSPEIPIDKYNAHIIMEELRPGISSSYTTSLYAEISSIVANEFFDNRIISGRLDFHYWGRPEDHVILLVLEKASACRILEFAAKRGLTNLLQIVMDLELADREDVLGSGAVYNAATRDLETTRFVLAMGFDLNFCGDLGTPLHRAVRKGDINAMLILIDFGADIDLVTDHSESALTLAMSSGRQPEQGPDLGALQFLLDKGAKLQTNMPALLFTCLSCHDPGRKALEKLLKHGADPDLLLCIAMLSGYQDNCRDMVTCMGMALQYCADPDLLANSLDNEYGLRLYAVKTYIGQSMLQIAAQNQSQRYDWRPTKTLGTLLAYGANINLVTEHETLKTALHAALHGRCDENVKYLLDHGAHIDPRAYEIVDGLSPDQAHGISPKKLRTILQKHDPFKLRHWPKRVGNRVGDWLDRDHPVYGKST